MGAPLEDPQIDPLSLIQHFEEAALGLAGGLTYGLGIGVIFGLVVGLAFGLSLGLAVALAFGLVIGLAGELTFGIVFGLVFGLAIGLSIGLAGNAALGLAGGIAYGFAFGLVGGLPLGLAFAVSLPRAYYLPLHWLFLYPRPKAQAYRWHPVAWDDQCGVRFGGLHRLLVGFSEQDPEKGVQEIDRLIDEYPSQQLEALRAKATLMIREAGQGGDLARNLATLQSLPEGKKGFLAQTPQVKEWLAEVGSIVNEAEVGSRPFPHEAEQGPHGAVQAALMERLERLRDEVSGLREPLASELHRVAEHWIALVSDEKT
ncbi:MAG: hypothetical protein AAGD01_19320 [Acidobacteriota bacterium]